MQDPQIIEPDPALDARLAGVIVVGDDDIAALEECVRGLAENSRLPDLHVCFVALESMTAGAQADLHRLASLLDGRCPWTVTLVGAPLDFTDLLRGVAATHPDRDIALLAPGAELPFAWDVRLAKAAYAAPSMAAAVPMCDVSPLSTLIDEEIRANSRLDSALIDRTAYCMGDRRFYEIPSIHPVCAYLRHDALQIALPFLAPGIADSRSVLDALAKRWRACGWSCVICDYVYVGYSGSALTPAATTGDVDETAFLQNHPLGGLRRAVKDAIHRGLPPVSAPGLDDRPVQLHIMHFWGGGLERWVRDFGRADSSRINMILTSYRIGETGGQRVVLYSDPAALIPVRTWDIARPIRSTASSSIEYRRILEQVLAEFDIETIIVSSLIGHSLDALTQPKKTIVVCHDFYPICQAINPQFGKTCERCTIDDLRRCAKSNPLNDFFHDQTSEEWHEMRSLFVSHLLAHRIEMVVPSPSVAATLRQLDPRLQELPIHVIPHGTDLDAPRVAIAPRAASQPLRIVVLGRLSVRKGTSLLQAACKELRPYAEITLIGSGDTGVELARKCGWNVIERYERDALPDLLRTLAPHAGLLASIIPETFSYTLSELTTLGVPPIVTALGSFKDRVVDGETGFLFEPTREALVGIVQKLHANPELLGRVARNLSTQRRGRTTAEMVNDYRVLLPAAPRGIARFRVGIGWQSGLTEPYRHLSEAYVQLNSAYEQTRVAYEHTQSKLDTFRSILEPWSREFEALDLKRRWWLAPRAARLTVRLLTDLYKTARALKQGDRCADPLAGNSDQQT